jgi:hypothetical protein
MSHSIQIGAAPADPGMKVAPGIQHVRASGNGSNAVHVSRNNINAPMSPADLEARTTITSGPNGDTIPTTHGPARLHHTVDGKTLVTIPGAKGGLQVTLAEAHRLGLLVDQQQKEPAKNETKPENPKDAETPTDDMQIDQAEVAAHATELNMVGNVLDKVGINSEEALTASVASLMETDELPANIEQVLVQHFGEDAGTIVANAEAHLTARVVAAVKAAGLSLQDTDAMQGLVAALEHSPALIPSYVAALRGQPAKLNALVNSYAASRRAR